MAAFQAGSHLGQDRLAVLAAIPVEWLLAFLCGLGQSWDDGAYPWSKSCLRHGSPRLAPVAFLSAWGLKADTGPAVLIVHQWLGQCLPHVSPTSNCRPPSPHPTKATGFFRALAAELSLPSDLLRTREPQVLGRAMADGPKSHTANVSLVCLAPIPPGPDL